MMRTLLFLLPLAILVASQSQALGQGGSDRFFQMLDRNRDGVLEGDELSRVPGPMRDSLGSGRVTPDQFARAVEAMRSQRGGGFGGGDRSRGGSSGGGRGSFGGGRGDFGGGRGGFSREGGGDRSRGGEGGGRFGSDRRRGGAAEDPKKKEVKPLEPITTELPESFTDGDLDNDGQIGMYEWRKWKSRSAYAEFMARDLNRDGFLTPRELVIVEKVGLETFMPATAMASASSTGTAPVSESRTESSRSDSNRESSSDSDSSQSSSSESSSSSSSSQSRAEALAGRYFGLLDRNKNGSIDPEEWDRSRRLKPKFEAAGADLSKPMSKDDFMKFYAKSN